MKRASSLVPFAWIYLSSSSRALQVATSARPNSLIRYNLLTSQAFAYQRRSSSSSIIRLMSSKSDEEKPRRKRVVRGAVKDAEEVPKKKAKGGKAKTQTVEICDNDVDKESPPTAVKKPRAKAVTHQILTDRDELPKLWNAAEHEDCAHSKLLSAVHDECNWTWASNPSPS